jgi:hypothetical protein
MGTVDIVEYDWADEGFMFPALVPCVVKDDHDAHSWPAPFVIQAKDPYCPGYPPTVFDIRILRENREYGSD